MVQLFEEEGMSFIVSHVSMNGFLFFSLLFVCLSLYLNKGCSFSLVALSN